MEFPTKRAIAVLILLGLAPYPSAAQREIQKHEITENVSGDEGQVASQPLSRDDGLAVIAAALDSSVHLRAKRDCCYVSSSDLCVGTSDFERVAHRKGKAVQPTVGNIAAGMSVTVDIEAAGKKLRRLALSHCLVWANLTEYRNRCARRA